MFFIKNTESYDVSFVTINQQTLYDSGILRQDYGNIRGLPVDPTVRGLLIGSPSGRMAAADDVFEGDYFCIVFFQVGWDL